MSLTTSRTDRLISSAGRALSWLMDRVPAGHPPLPPAPRVLILKPCCLGDVLMATPALAAVRASWPQAHIDFAVGPWSRRAVEHNAHINRLIECGPVGSGPYGLRDWWGLVRRVRAGNYQLCLVLDRSPLVGLVPAAAGIPHRVGLDSDGRGFALTQRVPVVGIRHEVDVYLDCVEALGLSVEGARLHFTPTLQARLDIEQLRLESRGPLIAIHPAGGQNPGMTLAAKRWPAERFAQLLRRLSESPVDPTIALLGADNDRDLAERIVALAGAPDRVVNLAGQLAFDRLGALLQRAALFIGNDTGAMHLAVAVGTPTVALFGPSDPRQYGPYGPGHRVLWRPPACAPCLSRGQWRQACRDFRCIEAISVDDVWEAVQDVLL